MQWFLDVIAQAVVLLVQFDGEVYEIAALTLQVSLTALGLVVVTALPLAAWLALSDGWWRTVSVTAVHTLMGLPPVLVGLLVYLLLSRQGPLGMLGLLFSPAAMIIAQYILIFPIVCGLSQQVFRAKRLGLQDLFESLQLSVGRRLQTIVVESRVQILGAIVSGLGRGLAEVGAVIIVGGNILHHTRTITTSIALQTSKGELVTAVSLGLLLLLIGLGLNIALLGLNKFFATH